jgi:hypothetical protein
VIHLIESSANARQIDEMLQAYDSYIKIAVDIEKRILAGGGELHADCEAVLLESGSSQDAIWGADWIPETNEVRFEALINIRPTRGNMSMEITDPGIRVQVEEIAKELLEGT